MVWPLGQQKQRPHEGQGRNPGSWCSPGRASLPPWPSAPLSPGRWDGISSKKLPAPQKHEVQELATFPFWGMEGVLRGGNRDRTLTPSGWRHTQWTPGAGQGLHPDLAPTAGGTGGTLLGQSKAPGCWRPWGSGHEFIPRGWVVPAPGPQDEAQDEGERVGR